MKRAILFIGGLFAVLNIMAQAAVEATIAPIEMLIGEHAQLTLTVNAHDGAKIEFPQLKPRKELVQGVEVLNTQQPSPNTLVITLTAFDGKLYYLPPLKVKVDGKETACKSLALKVNDVEVDTTQVDKFFGPKDVQDNPFDWDDWKASFWLSVLMLLMMAAAGWLWLRLRDNKPIIKHIRIVKRLLPHQKAMKEIEQIKADKMVSSENQKEYYTKLTETLRRYIEERYGFSAMEMTSSEIIERLTATADQQMMDELRQLFTTADLVKFAKYSTMINENDMNLVNAIDFINQTKLENQPTEETVKPVLTQEDIRTQKERRILIATIAVLVTASAAILCYIGYSVWQLIY
jgi:hypothetical protein